ncbi:MAG: hypothetical protein IJ870_05785 [Alphaproteobacteria bacterium]|nr:hypothetical protein [Alphaproteobacteria bacterium]
MKLFSFKKPVEIKDGKLIINELAKNQKFKKEGYYFVVEGYDEQTKQAYKAYYAVPTCEFMFIKLKTETHSVELVSWKEEHDTVVSKKIDNLGNVLTEISVYMTTANVSKKLIKRTFVSELDGEKKSKTFFLGDKIRSEGDFPKDHFKYWII